MLVTDEQGVPERRGGHERRPAGLSLDDRVGDQGGGMDDWRGDVGGADIGAAQQVADTRAHAVQRIRRGRECLVDVPVPMRLDEDDVGEGPPMSTASRQSALIVAPNGRIVDEICSWRGEHVEDRALAVLVVADEDRVAVPDRHRGEIDVASR